MMPPCSWLTPGRNPGTSSSVTMGMLKQSQKRTKRAALSAELISSTPASTIGCWATMPPARPHERPRAHDAARLPAEPREADDDVPREVLLPLHELAVVYDQRNHTL